MIPSFVSRKIVLAALLAGAGGVVQAQVAGTTTTYVYSAAGNPTQITDPLNRVTSQEFDVLGQLTKLTDAKRGVTQYAYDGLGQLVKVTDARGLVTSYIIDGLGNVSQVSSPDTGVSNSTYDAAGNLKTHTDGKGQTASFTYDALNRVNTVSYSDGGTVSYLYDQGQYGVGRLSRITDGSGTIDYAYDQAGHIISDARTIGAQTYRTLYHYDAPGRLIGITYPSGRGIEYSFDDAGRISEIRSISDGTGKVLATQIVYQPFGRLQSLVFGNGQTYARTYDLNGRMVSYTLNGEVQTVTYDAASRITAVSGASVSKTYGYDEIDRLTTEQRPTSSTAYAYDAVGNRSQKSLSGNVTSYGYAVASNRLTQVQGYPIASDANGSITDTATSQFKYDARGRMISANTAVGMVSYAVNVLGQRVMKTRLSAATLFHYDLDGKLLGESTGGAFTDYVYLDDVPVAVLK